MQNLKNGLSSAFLRDAAGFYENHTLKALNIPFKKVVWSGRVKCGGTEEEIVVAHGCLPSPARRTHIQKITINWLK